MTETAECQRCVASGADFDRRSGLWLCDECVGSSRTPAPAARVRDSGAPQGREQEEEQERQQEQADLPYVPSVPDPAPVPVHSEPEMRVLLAQHRAGIAPCVPVEMPALPLDAPPLAVAIYEVMALRWSLRLGAAMPDDRPLPYATTEAVRAGLCEHPGQASRAIHWLEDHGLIWSPGSMPPRGKPDGTRTFLPGSKPSGALPHAASDVEAADRIRRAVRVE
jgi:hypothetical protein